MPDKPPRSELNYLVAGAIMFFAGGFLVNVGQDDGGVAMIVVGALVLAIGIFLIGKGVLRGRR